MSDFTNSGLLQEAQFYLEYFDGTTMGKILQADVEANDLESLHHHLQEARDAAFQIEFRTEGI